MKKVELLRRVAEDLDAIGVQAFFFGGIVVGLHLDALPVNDEERPTTNVDCAPVAVASPNEMRKFEAKLDAAGWQQVVSGDKRNAYARIAPSGVPVDFVPLHTLDQTDALRLARRVRMEIHPDLCITVISSAGMVAAKLAAFRDRGVDDPLMSHDLEDLAMLLACCTTIEHDLELAVPGLLEQVQIGLAAIWEDRCLLEILDGNFPRGTDAEVVLARLEKLADPD
jgi:hypothetical protein